MKNSMPRRQAILGTLGALAVITTGAVAAPTAGAAAGGRAVAMECHAEIDGSDVASNYVYSTSYRSGESFYYQSVENIQRRMGVTQDGVYGAGTAAAVERFQASKGLVQDGVFGPKTAAAAGIHWGITRVYKGCY